MESNNCICINHYLKIIENMLNSLVNASVQIARNTNTPSTDSGYIANGNGVENFQPPQSNTNWLSTGFYLGIIIIGLLILLTGTKRKQSMK